MLVAAGWRHAAKSFNPWVLADRISLSSRNPDVFWIMAILPGLSLLLLYSGWGTYWWWCGCRLYLRLERPGAVAVALAVIILLAALLVQLWVWLIVAAP